MSDVGETPDQPDPSANLSPTPPAVQPKLDRPRKDKMKIDHAEIANRVIDFFDTDDMARNFDIEARLQRYAKFRMWTEGKEWPWELKIIYNKERSDACESLAAHEAR